MKDPNHIDILNEICLSAIESNGNSVIGSTMAEFMADKDHPHGIQLHYALENNAYLVLGTWSEYNGVSLDFYGAQTSENKLLDVFSNSFKAKPITGSKNRNKNENGINVAETLIMDVEISGREMDPDPDIPIPDTLTSIIKKGNSLIHSYKFFSPNQFHFVLLDSHLIAVAVAVKDTKSLKINYTTCSRYTSFNDVINFTNEVLGKVTSASRISRWFYPMIQTPIKVKTQLGRSY